MNAPTPRDRLPHAALLAALLAAAPAPSACGEPMCRIERQGTSFVCGGEPFAVVGFNCYYLMAYAADPGLRDEVDEVLREARSLGSTVVRTWAFSDGARWNALQVAPGVYDEDVFVGLDYVLHRAGQEGLRVILPLVNNWPDYGGMDQYVAWSDTASAHDDFYTDASARGWYRDHAARVLGRVNTFSGMAYRDDPTILGWELANEPRAAVKGPAALNAWIAEMAAHLKTLDPLHLVSTGSEGFYGPGSGRNPAGASWMSGQGVDFIAQHSVPGIDFASFHVWPDNWSLANDPAATASWVRDHLADARDVLGKPALLGEFGKRQPVATRDAWFGVYYDEVLAALEPGASRAGLLCWILYHDAYPDYDGYGIYSPAGQHASTVGLIREKHREIRERVPGASRFVRGDASCDAAIDISDPIAVILGLFAAGPPPCCADAADANDDERLDLADAVFALAFTFTGGPAPPPPFPDCGVDRTAAGIELGCARYPVCSR